MRLAAYGLAEVDWLQRHACPFRSCSLAVDNVLIVKHPSQRPHWWPLLFLKIKGGLQPPQPPPPLWIRQWYLLIILFLVHGMFPSHVYAAKSPHLFYPSFTCVTLSGPRLHWRVATWPVTWTKLHVLEIEKWVHHTPVTHSSISCLVLIDHVLVLLLSGRTCNVFLKRIIQLVKITSY